MRDFLLRLDALAHHPYCERLNSPSGFETLNVITNGAFLVTAYLGFKLLKGYHLEKSELKYLPIFIFLIGLGSTLYHSLPNLLTVSLDIAPIIGFTVISAYLVLKRIFFSRWLKSIIVVYLLIQIGLAFIPGPQRHVFSLMTAVVLFILVHQRIGKLAFGLLSVIFLYGLALVIGLSEPTICPYFPLGTHFIWHILVSITTYIVVRFLVVMHSKVDL